MERIKHIINIVLKNKEKKELKELNSDTHLRDDLGLNSLDLAELTVRIEAEYEVDIFADGIVNTVGEILMKIEAQK